MQLAILTDAGWDKIVDTAPGHAEAVQRLVFDVLGPGQLAQLDDMSETLLHNLR